MEYMFLPLKRYADFSGRSRRKEYWMFFLLYLIVVLVLTALLFAGIFGAADSDSAGVFGGTFAIVIVLLALAVFIPSIAVQVRRFHDQDKSGWLVLLNFVPYIGGIVVLVFMCMEGTRGPNRFGPDPKDETGADVASIFS